MSKQLEIQPDGSLVLTLDEACIQTAAKKAHREIALALLDGVEQDEAMEGALDLLERFIDNTDFATLRARHPELAGHAGCRVRLVRDEDGTVRWETWVAR
ncbi:MAG: hypothetical protein JW797_14645 [Bradymonadales bacterium]|nr:hypothetical protein [Bradymonadales bacterium]